ncbi:MAG: aldo/keto reductase [Planctomycetota bacterium]
MELRQVPGTEIKVSPICLGTMTYGRPVGKKEAIRLTQVAIGLGINFIDTANMYEGYDRKAGSAGGVAEEILGEALAGRREDVVLITKVGNAIGPGNDDRGLGRTHVRREIERSLRRLGTDHVDFYLAHRPDPETQLEEVAETFGRLVEEGKVRHWGFSNFSGPEVEELAALAKGGSVEAPRLSQPPYSMLNREIEREHLPACRRNDIGVVCYRVLESGLLTGKYRRGEAPPSGSRASEKPEWVNLEKIDESTFAKVDAVCALAREASVAPGQYAISWVIAQPGVLAAIVGVKREEQIQEAAAAASYQLSSDELVRLRKIL